MSGITLPKKSTVEILPLRDRQENSEKVVLAQYNLMSEVLKTLRSGVDYFSTCKEWDSKIEVELHRLEKAKLDNMAAIKGAENEKESLRQAHMRCEPIVRMINGFLDEINSQDITSEKKDYLRDKVLDAADKLKYLK